MWLQGCVNSAEEAAALERLVRNIDDVETVIDELSIGTAAPRYEVRPRD